VLSVTERAHSRGLLPSPRGPPLHRGQYAHPGAPVMTAKAFPVVSVYSVVLLGLMGLSAGCTSIGESPSAGQGHPSLPPNCTHTITQAGDLSGLLAAVSPGDTVCFSGPDLVDADAVVTRSGTAAAPIRLVADELVTVHEVQIKADHVTLEGFTVTGGGGVLLQEAGITARNNVVHDTTQGGSIVIPAPTRPSSRTP
jgi:hypothetical protein